MLASYLNLSKFPIRWIDPCQVLCPDIVGKTIKLAGSQKLLPQVSKMNSDSKS